MSALAGQTWPFIRDPLADESDEFVVAILCRGKWKESRHPMSLEKAHKSAQEIHARTGLVVQVRDGKETIIAQFGCTDAECLGSGGAWSND